MKKQRIPNGKYTKEFREEAVKLITEGGSSVHEAGRNLPVAENITGQNFDVTELNRV